MVALLAVAAEASPYWTATPATTLAKHDGEFAGGAGYVGVLSPYTDQAVLSAWARWAATDRWEVVGGASLPIAPTLIGVHGTWRCALGPLGADAGVAVDVQGFPVFVALGADAGTSAAVSALIGVGYGMDQ